MVLAMCPADNCACSKDQEPAAIGQEQADRHTPDDAECPHLTRLFSERFQNEPLVNPFCSRGVRCHGTRHGASPVEIKLTHYRFRALLRTDSNLIYSSELPTQLRSTACRCLGLPLSRQRPLPAHQARLSAIEE